MWEFLRNIMLEHGIGTPRSCALLLALQLGVPKIPRIVVGLTLGVVLSGSFSRFCEDDGAGTGSSLWFSKEIFVGVILGVVLQMAEHIVRFLGDVVDSVRGVSSLGMRIPILGRVGGGSLGSGLEATIRGLVIGPILLQVIIYSLLGSNRVIPVVGGMAADSLSEFGYRLSILGAGLLAGLMAISLPLFVLLAGAEFILALMQRWWQWSIDPVLTKTVIFVLVSWCWIQAAGLETVESLILNAYSEILS